jgi:hypothetical protein
MNAIDSSLTNQDYTEEVIKEVLLSNPAFRHHYMIEHFPQNTVLGLKTRAQQNHEWGLSVGCDDVNPLTFSPLTSSEFINRTLKMVNASSDIFVDFPSSTSA